MKIDINTGKDVRIVIISLIQIERIKCFVVKFVQESIWIKNILNKKNDR